MSNDLLARKKRTTSNQARVKSQKSLFSIVSDIHLDVYGQPTKDTNNSYFVSQLNKLIPLVGEENFENHLEVLVRSFMEHNRDHNEEKFSRFCTIDMMTNSYALSNTWPQLVKHLGLMKPKKAENPTREYFGIEEHFGFIVLNDGLSSSRVLKADCHEVKKDGESFFYPKDNRTKSLYDYTGLMEFLEIKKPHDFGELPYIGNEPCYGFYVCSSYPKSCSYKCGKFKKLKYLLKASEIPTDYLEPMPFTESPDIKQNTDLRTSVLLEIRDNIVFYVESGFNAVLYSKQTGTGKTSWACTIAKHFIFRRMPKNMLEPEAFYLNTAEYFSLIKSSMSLKDESIHIEIAQLNNLIKDVPLLVIDDIGTEKPSEFVRERLYQIINYRASHKKSTIYTTNLDFNSNEAIDILGSRIVSRLRNATIIDFDREVN